MGKTVPRRGAWWSGAACLLPLLAFAPPVPAADAPPPAPAAFGIRLGDQTAAVHARMREAGYRSREMRLDGGCVVERFEHASPDAAMRRADIWLCGPERRVAAWEIEGRAGEAFYAAAKERFGLGAVQRQGDAVGAGFGDYARRFDGGVRLSMTNTRGTARLRLEDPEALRKSAAAQEQDERHLDETAAAQEQARRKQQEAHF